MTGSHRITRLAAALLVSLAALVTLSPAAADGATTRSTAELPVTIAVSQVSPSTPTPSATPQNLSIALTLTNTTSSALTGVQILAQRGEPIGSQSQLNSSLADSSVHDQGLSIPATHAVSFTIPARGTVSTSFTTTTSITQDTGLCLCADAVYPLDLSAVVTSSGAQRVVGSARTYVPSFDIAPTTMSVSWVWPLIDRPHRLSDGTVFTDDSLTELVAPDGRLYRSLQVLEGLPVTMPITVVVDPELLDELEIMSTGRYTVQQAGGTAVPGAGQQVARAWLTRLQNLLSSHPYLALDRTPYADPDVQALSAEHLTWSTSIPADMEAAVSAALGGRDPATTLAWVPGGRLDKNGFAALTRSGVTTALLNASAVSPDSSNGIPLSLARVRGGASGTSLALLSPAMQQDVAAALTQSADPDGNALPRLVAELAARVAQSGTTAQFAVLTPPRYVDPTPAIADRVILDTVSTPFSTPVDLATTVARGTFPSPAVTLRSVPTGGSALPGTQLDRSSYISSVEPAILKMLANSAPGLALAQGLPHALQRVESAAWRTDSTNGGPVLGARLGAQLGGQVASILSAVTIVKPSSGSYTLASSNSPVPITVHNDLSYPVAIRIAVSPTGGLPGFSARDLGTQVIPPGSKQTLRVPADIARSGRIPVEAVLSAPNGYRLGEVKLYIHSTALGTIGVVITVAAGVILFLALLVRYVRRIRRLRRRRRHPPSPVAHRAFGEHERVT